MGQWSSVLMNSTEAAATLRPEGLGLLAQEKTTGSTQWPLLPDRLPETAGEQRPGFSLLPACQPPGNQGLGHTEGPPQPHSDQRKDKDGTQGQTATNLQHCPTAAPVQSTHRLKASTKQVTLAFRASQACDSQWPPTPF